MWGWGTQLFMFFAVESKSKKKCQKVVSPSTSHTFGLLPTFCQLESVGNAPHFTLAQCVAKTVKRCEKAAFPSTFQHFHTVFQLPKSTSPSPCFLAHFQLLLVGKEL